MAVLNIRNLTDDIHRRLRRRAQRNGRSMEAEARTILQDALLQEDRSEAALARVWELIDALYGDRKPANASGELIADRRREARREARREPARKGRPK